MCAFIKTLLITQLIVAQLVAPLVHAHVGGEAASGNIHLPGLELFAVQPEQPVSQPVQLHQEQPGMAVGIATGMQTKQLIGLPAAPWVFTAPLALLLPRIYHPDTPRAAPSPIHAPPRITQAAPRAPPYTPFI